MTVTPFPCPPTQTPDTVREIIDTQQQTIKFLLGQWNALLAQVAIGGGDFGTPQVLAQNALVPSGWWQSVTPTTGVIANATINSTTVPINAGLFWSDGNVVVTLAGGITIAAVGVME